MSERFSTQHLEATIATQGRTKRWVANRAGISESMLAHVISGQKTISRDAAERIADSLQVPFFLLFESASADRKIAIAIVDSEAVPA